MTADRAPTREVSRRSGDDRRKELLGIGLRMITNRPWHQITIDAVAAEAGISRSLLFHYFPSKQDYFTELVQAGARRLLRATEADPDADSPLESIIARYVGFLRRRRGPYLGLIRTSVQDASTETIHDHLRDVLTERVLDALNLSHPSSEQRLMVRAWWAFAEELIIQWATQTGVDQDRLESVLLQSIRSVISLADR